MQVSPALFLVLGAPCSVLWEIDMSADLKWAHRCRIDLAFEIEQLESGLRRVTQNTANGSVDITDKILAAQKCRFEQLEDIIAAARPVHVDD